MIAKILTHLGRPTRARRMAFSGLGQSGATNNTVEIYDLKNAGAGWTSPVSAPFSPPLYPHMGAAGALKDP